MDLAADRCRDEESTFPCWSYNVFGWLRHFARFGVADKSMSQDSGLVISEIRPLDLSSKPDKRTGRFLQVQNCQMKIDRGQQQPLFFLQHSVLCLKQIIQLHLP